MLDGYLIEKFTSVSPIELRVKFLYVVRLLVNKKIRLILKQLTSYDLSIASNLECY